MALQQQLPPKRWIIEAIHERLDEERAQVQVWLEGPASEADQLS